IAQDGHAQRISSGDGGQLRVFVRLCLRFFRLCQPCFSLYLRHFSPSLCLFCLCRAFGSFFLSCFCFCLRFFPLCAHTVPLYRRRFSPSLRFFCLCLGCCRPFLRYFLLCLHIFLLPPHCFRLYLRLDGNGGVVFGRGLFIGLADARRQQQHEQQIS